jgi:hypothetical protein
MLQTRKKGKKILFPPPKPHPNKKKPFLPLSSGKRKRPHP